MKKFGEALSGQKGTYPADIQLLDKQLETLLIKSLSSNNIKELAEYKDDISEILIKKAKIAGELSPAGSHINKLIEQRRRYEEQLNNGQEYINANISGVISYRVDRF